VKLRLKVVPGSSREGMEWLDNDCSILKVKVTAPPEKGKANKAVAKYLGKVLGIPAKDITITSGTSSQQKIIELANISEQAFTDRIQSLLDDR